MGQYVSSLALLSLSLRSDNPFKKVFLMHEVVLGRLFDALLVWLFTSNRFVGLASWGRHMHVPAQVNFRRPQRLITNSLGRRAFLIISTIAVMDGTRSERDWHYFRSNLCCCEIGFSLIIFCNLMQLSKRGEAENSWHLDFGRDLCLRRFQLLTTDSWILMITRTHNQ